MGTSPLPINQKPYYNSDSIANSIAADDMYDCYLEPVPDVGLVTRRRPGLKLFGDLGTGAPGDGLFWREAAKTLIGVSNGEVFNINSDGVATKLTGEAPITGAPVVFADGQDTGGKPWLYMASGKLIYTTDGITTVFPRYVGQVVATANPTGYATVYGNSWAMSATTGPDSNKAYIVEFTNNNPNDYSNLTANVVGFDILDTALTEMVYLPLANGVVKTTEYFKSITSITPSGSIGTVGDPAWYSVTPVTGSTWGLTRHNPPDTYAYKVTILNNSTTDMSAKTVTLTGTDLNGTTLTEVIALPIGSDTVKSTQFFMTLVTAVPSASIGSDTVSIGFDTLESMDIGWSDQSVENTSSNVPVASHVAFLKGVFLANNINTNQFLFTDTSPYTSLVDNAFWGSSDNPMTCDAKGNTLSALMVAWQEVYAWGSEGLEIWQYDGVTPLSPIPGAFSEGGIEAPYSLVIADNTVFALCVIAGARVVIKLQGRAPVVCSDAIGRVLAEMSDVSDAIGDLISVGGIAIYLLNFPSAGQTWAYDYKNDVWSRWGYWQDGEHSQFIGRHAVFAKPWNKHLIMSRVDGKIYELDRNTFDDAGNAMVSFRRTGWLNHGTYNRKVCDQFYLKCKAGLSDIATLLLRWRDEGKEEWSNYVEVKLSPVGVRDFLAKMNRMGMYRSRQYEFRLTDNTDLVLVGVDVEMRGLSS
jgi:hypothetical protein